MPGLDFADSLGDDDTREEIRKIFEEAERARAEYRAGWARQEGARR